jgi:arginine/lysine/ornithine decarboxylase
MKVKAPLVERIKGHIVENPVSFHVPGHKGCGSFMDTGAMDLGGFLQYDLTELPGLDNLHCPGGAIQKAQNLAATAYGVEGTYFLVNGSTAGIMASLLAAALPGDAILVDRGCHSSVYSGLILGRLKPLYIQRPVEETTGIPLSIHPREVEKALGRDKGVKAVIITSPTYYGVCSDIKKIAETAHQKGALLIVDEAHGAHLKFSDALPKSAVDLGADMVIQSAHKTLPAMTQGSWLHIMGSRVDRERLERMLGMFQTTSPSYPIMASLDNARYMMENAGAKHLGEVLGYVRDARHKIDALDKGLFCPDGEYFRSRGSFDFDDTKMLINCAGAGLTGSRLDQDLRERCGVYGELYDAVNWLGIVTVASRREDFERLVGGCVGLKTVPDGDRVLLPSFLKSPVPAAGMDPWEVLDRRLISIDLSRAENRIAGSSIVPYPPGIPLVCPGESFSAGAIRQIRECMDLNIAVKGVKHGQVEVVE